MGLIGIHNMILWRIKHRQTGLYYGPSRGTRCNMKKRGKIYTMKPSLSWMQDSYYDTEGNLIIMNGKEEDHWELVREN